MKGAFSLDTGELRVSLTLSKKEWGILYDCVRITNRILCPSDTSYTPNPSDTHYTIKDVKNLENKIGQKIKDMNNL